MARKPATAKQPAAPPPGKPDLWIVAQVLDGDADWNNAFVYHSRDDALTSMVEAAERVTNRPMRLARLYVEGDFHLAAVPVAAH